MRADIKKVYLLAALLSFVLYFSGMFTGIYLQSFSIEHTEERIKLLRERLENVQLEYMYLNTMESNTSCNFLSVLLGDVSKEIYNIGKQLTEYEERKENPEKSIELASEYSLLSVRAWMLNSYVNSRCKENKVTILYFYSVPCSECEQQGKILDALWEKYGDKIKIFVLNINSNETIVQLLVKTYGISKTPSIVIRDSTYKGIVDKETLEKIILSDVS